LSTIIFLTLSAIVAIVRFDFEPQKYNKSLIHKLIFLLFDNQGVWALFKLCLQRL